MTCNGTQLFLGYAVVPYTMRLVHIDTLEMKEFQAPPDNYAILSHCWTDDEISFKDFVKRRRTDSHGYWKVKRFCEFIQRCQFMRRSSPKPGFQFISCDKMPIKIEWIWIDTCCIDKRSSAELSEAINSMWTWYSEASYCIVYLADVPSKIDSQQIPEYVWKSRWLTRGWTLQELLASRTIIFCDSEWQSIGNLLSEPSKVACDSAVGFGATFAPLLSEITAIPLRYLQDKSALTGACFAQKANWASKRETTRSEDMAYCLLGLMNVNMPLLYGEGGEKAFVRLQKEYINQYDDESVFAWSIYDMKHLMSTAYLLARTTDGFRGANDVGALGPLNAKYQLRLPYAVTNKGLQITARAIAVPDSESTSSDSFKESFIVPLNCTLDDPRTTVGEKKRLYFIALQDMGDGTMIRRNLLSVISDFRECDSLQRIFMQQPDALPSPKYKQTTKTFLIRL